MGPSSLCVVSAFVRVLGRLRGGSPGSIATGACAWLIGVALVSPVSAQTLSRTSLALGNVPLGQTSAAKAVTLTNTLSMPLTITSITLEGPAASDYAITTTCPVSPGTLAAGKRCRISVTLTPSALGARLATLSINHDGPAGPQSVGLSGTGVEPVSLTPEGLSFGNQALGTTSVAKTVTLANQLATSLAIAAIDISGPFVRAGGTCPESGMLAAGGKCTILLSFSPSVLGPATGSLVVIHDAGAARTVSLSGTGIVPVAVTPTSLKFSTTTVGSTSATKTVTIKNQQPTSLGLASITVDPDFTIAGSACGSALAPGASCTVQVAFAPPAAGTRTGSLTVIDDSVTSPQVVSLTGTGLASLKVSKSTLTFAARSIGTTSAPLSVTLTNQTSSSLTLNGLAASGDFAVTGGTCGAALTAGGTCAVAVSFTPTAVGVREGLLSIAHSGLDSPTGIALSGTGDAAGLTALEVQPADVELAVGATQAFVATGTFSDGRTEDLTASASWSSSNAAVATVGDGPGDKGSATAVGTGSADITASLGAFSDAAVLRVYAPLSVAATAPAGGATGVPRNTSISVIFSTAIDPATLTVNIDDAVCSGSLQVSADEFTTCVPMAATPIANSAHTIFTVTPALPLTGGAAYQIRTTTAVSDASGRALAAGFTTVPGFTTAATLAVTAVSPADGATGVATSTPIRVAFNRAIAAATLTVNTGDTACSGSLQVSADDFVTCVRMTAAPVPESDTQYRVQPAVLLASNTLYRIRVTTGVQDDDGLPLPSVYTSPAGFRTTAAALTSLTVTPSSAIVGLGQTLQLTATAAYGDGTTADVTASATWTVGTRERGSVSAGGLATTLASGTNIVTASLSGRSGSAAITGRSLTHVRQGQHTATALSDGRVLVVGGLDGKGATASAEVYDPATGVFTATGSLTTARRFHTATRLADGRVLVVGGVDGGGGVLASAEVYDPATGVWMATGSLTTGRYVHTATLIGTQVLVVGGYQYPGYPNELASAEVYDPATGVWTATGSLTTGRYGHTATLLGDGRVLVAGGYNRSRSPRELVSAEVYDSATGVWTATGSLTTGRWYHTATLLSDGRVLVAGGAGSGGTSAEVYDAASGAWTATGPLAVGRWGHTATLLPDGQVLIAGGQGSGSAGQSTELYDAAAGVFTLAPNLAYGRSQPTATLLGSGAVLLVGGDSSGATAELRQPGVVLTGLTIAPASRTVTLGSSAFFTATGTFSDGSTATVTNAVSWAVTPATVAYVSGPGNLRTVGTGTATVTAGGGGGLTATASLTVE